MTNPNDRLAYCLKALVRRGVQMIVKTEYEDGKPVREIVFPVMYEKRGNFHYLGGKRVCRNLVIEANLCGLVKFY